MAVVANSAERQAGAPRHVRERERPKVPAFPWFLVARALPYDGALIELRVQYFTKQVLSYKIKLS